MPPGAGVLATHSAVTAIPFFVPTLVVVAVICVVVWRDRRRHPAGDDAGTGDDGSPGADRRGQVPGGRSGDGR